MDFYAVLDQVVDLLRSRGRVSYRALKRQFALDDELLADLAAELRYAHYPIEEDHDQGLLWTGETVPPLEHTPPPSRPETEFAPHADRPPAEARAPEAERRQLTVLFCDLVDSTVLASQLDPEAWREVVRAYQETCATVITRFEGHIAQYLGDGLLLYFGYPQAHEDDAQRAVRTGLGIVEAVGQLNTRLAQERGVSLAVRLGIHTGQVVVGEIGGGAKPEQLALGETPNIAARLQSLAAPDTVVISAATSRLVEGYFTCAPLGVRDLKGLSQPFMVYQILHASGIQTRLDVAATRGLTPLVGRDAEITLLLERWTQVKDGRGQVVLLNGEAGIGKSRLMQAFKEQLAQEPHTRWECRCSPYYHSTALYPLIDWFQRALPWEPEDPADAKREKLEQALRQYRLPLEETVPLMATLLSLPLPEDRYPPLALSPQRQKQKTLETILALMLETTEHHPVLLIVEDLHWVDPSTVEFLSLVVDQAPTARLCTLFTFRPEFIPPWASRAHLTPLALSRLSPNQAKSMVEGVASGKVLPAEVQQQIVAKTDGVPLFVEELTKMVLESSLLREREECYELTGPLTPLAIPATLHDSLMARLDRLTTGKTVAQLGATIGRTFAYTLLQSIAALDEATLQHALRQLVEAELVYQRGVTMQAVYTFKHALIQDVAYQSLLKSTRQQYHHRIAQVLAERFPETAETQPELIAHHYTEAGLGSPAIDFWQRAGRRSIERSAHVEAVSHLTKGLELLRTLPDTPARTQRELRLHIALGTPLTALKGFAAPEVERTYIWARELCQRIGEPPQLFPVLMGLWRLYCARGIFQTTRELAEQLFALAQRLHDPARLLGAHNALGSTLLWLGEAALARTHLAQGIALYNPPQHRSHAFRSGQDLGVACLAFTTWVLWLLGYPDQALAKGHEALMLARDLSHPFSLAYALHFVAGLHLFRREGPAAQNQAEALRHLSTEQGFPLWVATGTLFRGWAWAAQGQAGDGIMQIR
jgi:class 3 adenylate cyclase/tetratricopeptide (TPR) repeat protein